MQAPSPCSSASQVRQQLLETLLDSVKKCQIRFGGKAELATESNEAVADTCAKFEAALQHGMKETTASLSFAVIKNVKDLVTNNFGLNETVSPPIWRIVKTVLNKHEYERYLLLKNITNDTGRGRAWLRSALNEQYLERYMHMLIGDANKLADSYEEWAFLRDQERASMLPSMAAGLGSIRFAINIDNPSLNGEDESKLVSPLSVSLSSVFVPSQKTVLNHDPHIAEVKQSADKVKVKKKKKGRVTAQIVSFDEEELRDVAVDVVAQEASSESAPVTCVNSPSDFDTNPNASKYSFEDPAPIKEVVLSPLVTSDPYFKYKIHQRTSSSTSIISSESNPGRINIAARNASSSSMLSLSSRADSRSSLGKSPQFSYNPVNLDDKQEDEDEGFDIYKSSATPSILDKSVVTPPPPPTTATYQSLTPIANPNMGALFPCDLQQQNSNGSYGSDEAAHSDSNSNPSCGPEDGDYASPIVGSKARSDVLSMNSALSAESSKSSSSLSREELKNSAMSSDGARSNSSLSRDDLKQALLSVMGRKDELEQQTKSLRTLLDQELERVSQLNQEINDERSKSEEKIEKLESRNSILSRENELLKHQLKKYVGAVQKLRDGPQAYETLAQLDGSKDADISKKYIDYHFEASEYEKKLIQVAEMHGELLEFNEKLQQTLKTRDSVISRLRADLISLRGPLPEDEDMTDDSESVTSSMADSASMGHARVLINIWIPSVFMKGSGVNQHHVYQVYVRIRDTEWNIFRRYSHFYDLHKELRKKDPVVNSFEFPPKKTVGNKADRFVDDRRKALQIYIRSIVNYLVTTNPTLANSPNKETLLTLLPFFGDSTSEIIPQRSSLFSRRRRTDDHQTQLVL